MTSTGAGPTTHFSLAPSFVSFPSFPFSPSHNPRSESPWVGSHLRGILWREALRNGRQVRNILPALGETGGAHGPQRRRPRRILQSFEGGGDGAFDHLGIFERQLSLRQLLPLGDPLMRDDLVDGKSLRGIDVQHGGDELLGAGRDRVPVAPLERETSFADAHEDVVGRVVGPRGEGRLAGQHGVEQHAETPDVAGGVVALLLQHLGRHEVGRVAGRHEQAVLGAQLLGEAEVADAKAFRNVIRVAVQNVGRLEVSMHHAVRVQKVHRFRKHFQHGRSLALREKSLPDDFV